MSKAKSGHLSYALATWIYMVFDRGHAPADAQVEAACRAVSTSTTDDEVDAAGLALAGVLADHLGSEPDFQRVITYARQLFGQDRVSSEMGSDRDGRQRAARRYQFSHSLPWLARIIDRFPDGSVGAHWVLVEQVTDVVTCMDPYPWDDLDEEYSTPVGDFLVKWELAGAESLRFV